MGYSYYDYDEKRLQKKLIPLNLFVALLALVAAISLIFAPILTIDMGALATAISEMQQDGENQEEGGEGGGDMMTAMFGNFSGVNLSITAIGASKVALAENDKTSETLLNMLLLDNDLLPTMVTSAVNTKFIDAIGVTDKDIDINELNTSLNAINNAKTKEEFNTATESYVTTVCTLAELQLEDEEKAQIIDTFGDLYDGTVDKVGEGNFSLEAMSCLMISEVLQEGGTEVEITSYKDLISYLTSDEFSASSQEGSEFAEVANMIAQLDEYSGYFGYIFYAMVGFAAIWLILFLFAFLHMFGKNKRFTMWYAKLLGGIPFLLFGGASFILNNTTIITNLVELPISLAGILSSMTWISGACYLLLWLVSILWAFPIKHKIRKLRK